MEEMGKKKNRKKKGGVWGYVVVFLLGFSLSFVVLSGVRIVMWVIENNKAEDLRMDLSGAANVREVSSGDEDNVNPPEDEADDYWDFVKLPLVSVDFSELKRRNPDTVGWINVRSTNINYPIVQAGDNDYYLKHAYDRSYNGAGWIFADYQNNMKRFDKNTVIYGHSRLDYTMFGSLKNVLQESWYANKDNHVVFLSTPQSNTMWQVFSAYKIEPESYYLTTSFSGETAYANFLEKVRGRSVHDFRAEVGVRDKILTISTCANNREDERIVLHARLIKEQARE